MGGDGDLDAAAALPVARRQRILAVVGDVLAEAREEGTGHSQSVSCAPGGDAGTDEGAVDGELAFGYRQGALSVEYSTPEGHGEPERAGSGSVGGMREVDDHAPLADVAPRYEALEQSVLELVAEAVPSVLRVEALDDVTAWPVANDAGLYRVGYDVEAEASLYAVAFALPPSTLERHG